MKISIITVVYNAESTILDTLEAVATQTYTNIEHIVVDGASTDGTMDRIEQSNYQPTCVVSEPDSGIYDAMNKGIALATGDMIGLLNADDVYQSNSVLAQVAAVMADAELDACYADLVYVKSQDLSAVTRYWRSREYAPGLCFRGWMPAHPTFFLRRSAYTEIGPYRADLKYQADLEFCARAFEQHKIRSRYVPELWVRMRLGGVTNNSFRTMWHGNWESYRALKALGMRRNPLWYFCLKFGAKIPQFIFRR
ncbi:glycosyltransferase family 2 protein [Arenicella xantha]|uniref:Glycosyltransferase involved in cell wall biosynthesis n=1 Tax=Arenicella xantha TaxID=644221 RepID=A0A395JLM7_9GAMM|nr:glycosyltransferase family 2 protein [Arenicella xantha]RBP51509.1 glycosyltransferase involved in cell wall biosynthesis [Arenicella xantha]